MRNIILFITLFLFIFLGNARGDEVIVFADFEDGTLQGMQAWAGSIVEVEDNFFPDETNSSDKVLAFAASSEWSAVMKWNNDGEIYDPAYTAFMVDVWVPENQLTDEGWAGFQLFGLGSVDGNPQYQQALSITTTEQWVTLVFRIDDMVHFDYKHLALQYSGLYFYSDNYRFVIEANPVFADFEDGTHQGFNDQTSTVVDNPNPDAVNSSEYVLLYEGNAFSGPNKWLESGGHFNPEYLKMRVDVYVTTLADADPWDESFEGNVAVFRLWGMGSVSDAPNWTSASQRVFETNKWHRLEFDLSMMEHFDYRNFFFQSHFTSFYVDNFQWITVADYPVSLLASPPDGGQVAGAGNYSPGNEITISAIPSVGYSFISWTDQDGDVVSTEPEYTFEMPAEAVEFTANFEQQPFTLTLNVQPASGGSVSADPEQDFYTYQQQITLTAIPAEGYNFVNWRKDGVTLSSEKEFVYTMPAEDVIISAIFLEEDVPLYTLSLVANPEIGGTVSGAGDFAEGDLVTIVAAPADNFAFINWTDEEGSVLSDLLIYEFQMPAGNITLTGNFQDVTSIENPFAGDQLISIFPNPAKDHITMEATERIDQVRILNLKGQVVYTNPFAGQQLTLSLAGFDSGLYFVHLQSAGKIWVRKIQITQ